MLPQSWVKVAAAFIKAGFCFHSWERRERSLHLPWYSTWPCPASFLLHNTSARADLVRFLVFAAFRVEKYKNTVRVHCSRNWKWENPKAWKSVAFTGCVCVCVCFGGFPHTSVALNAVPVENKLFAY